MEVTAVITKKDLLALNLYLLPRLKGNWIFFVLLALGVWSFLLLEREPDNSRDVGLTIFAALVSALVGTIACAVVNMITMLLTLGKDSGVLGTHHYCLSDSGFHDRTESNESMQKWRAIQSITRTPQYVLLRISAYLFYIVPSRAFHTPEEFDAFYKRAIELKASA